MAELDTAQIITWGGLAGAAIAIGRLFLMVKDSGAEKQEIKDAICQLQKDFTKISEGAIKADNHRREIDKQLFAKLDELKDSIHKDQIRNSEKYGEITTQLAALNSGGCKPVKEG